VTLGQLLSVNKNENTNADNNVTQSKQTKEFLERLTPQSWLDEKRRIILDKFEIYLGNNFELSKEFYGLVEKAMKNHQNAQAGVTEKDIKIEVMERYYSNLEFVEIEDLKYGMFFDKEKPDELIKMFAKLEEENLALINAQQETQETINEEMIKFEEMILKREQMIDSTGERKRNLDKAIAALDFKVKGLKEIQSNKKTTSNENPYKEIEAVVRTFLEEFKFEKELRHTELGVIPKAEAINKEDLLKYLKAIERLLIDQITKLTETNQLDDIKRLKNEVSRKKNKEEDKKKDLQDKELEKKLKTEKRLAALKGRRGRKDMFKKAFADQQDEVEDNNNDEELLEFQKYFLD
jgi:hypothetical protein